MASQITCPAAASAAPTLIRLCKIRIDGGTQLRVEVDDAVVDEYGECLESLPPVDVFFDGLHYWLADGFHRYFSYEKAGRSEIPCLVHEGDRREAVLYSCGANSAHGLKRTNIDKRRAILTLLQDEEWSARSDRWIAEKCVVSHPLVAELRKRMSEESTGRISSCRVSKDGKTRDTAGVAVAHAARKKKLTLATDGSSAAEADRDQASTGSVEHEPGDDSELTERETAQHRTEADARRHDGRPVVDSRVREEALDVLGKAGRLATELGIYEGRFKSLLDELVVIVQEAGR